LLISSHRLMNDGFYAVMACVVDYNVGYGLEHIKPQNAAKNVIQQRQGNPSSHLGNSSTARVSLCLATGLISLNQTLFT